jgi:hypothetical protein
MNNFYFRTESIRSDEISSLFVGTAQDRQIIDSLKSSDSVVLEGSRGTGKSFLLRMAEVELKNDFDGGKVLPVYLTFVASSLIHTEDPEQFKHWMLASICYRLIRALRSQGLLVGASPATALLSGGNYDLDSLEERFSGLHKAYEESYKNSEVKISPEDIPDLIHLKDAIEEICEEYKITRICLLFDEAIHVFRPEQQRQFFTLFRDLRSPYISCKAAVYPGVTSYGGTFEMLHDATHLRIERDILSDEYLDNMKEIVFKQSEETLKIAINGNANNFKVIAYSASGNPRNLLKTIDQCKGKMKTKDVNDAIKSFYRSDIWIEHTGLGDKYKGHRAIVDWGRKFLEEDVIPSTKQKNEVRAEHNESTCYFWIHRDAPEPAKEALRLLEYTGIVLKKGEGVRGTSSELGVRYEIKLGCILAFETSPIASGTDIIRNLTLQRFTEYGFKNPKFQDLDLNTQIETDAELVKMIREQLKQSIDILYLNEWHKNKLKECGLLTIESVLNTPEEEMQDMMRYVGPVRSRRMRNSALAELLEYLSG